MSVNVEQQSVRLVLSDDLGRSRLTVAFRLLLAIPHLVWYVLFSLGALIVAVLAWFAALVRGAVPGALHGFLASYLRYSTHLFAYLSLAANPYPGFTGDPGYPVDLEIDPPRPQRRLAIAFRLFLALPALLLAAALAATPNAGGWGGGPDDRDTFAWSAGAGGVLWTVAFLGWFAVLARGRAPLGFRNLAVYALRYAAQAWAYTFLLTDRYPNADPRLPADAGTITDRPVRVRVDETLTRSRLTVFFRLFLALPHLVWLALWTVVVIVAALANLLITLVRGRSPVALHRFLAAYVRYSAHVNSYLFLIANPFPGFTGGPYPVTVEIAPPERQNRWVTGFRWILDIPAWLVTAGLAGVLVVAGFLGWFFALVTGRMPRGLREAGAYAIRYTAETGAYTWVLTDRYPFSGPPVADVTEPPPAAAAPLDASG
jgi:hypothetical protein